MTETFYRTGAFRRDFSTFGGRICASDFNRKTTLSEAAARIMADMRFDRQCRKNSPDNEAASDEHGSKTTLDEHGSKTTLDEHGSEAAPDETGSEPEKGII